MCGVMPYSVIENYQCFKGTSSGYTALKMDAAGSFDTCQSAKLYGVTSQKMVTCKCNAKCIIIIIIIIME
jgi:hypothetical protein